VNAHCQEKGTLNHQNTSMKWSSISQGDNAYSSCEITYEDAQWITLNIQRKSGEKSNDSAKKVYATEKQSRKFKLTQIRNSRY
jgi:hypothetical protein